MIRDTPNTTLETMLVTIFFTKRDRVAQGGIAVPLYENESIVKIFQSKVEKIVIFEAVSSFQNLDKKNLFIHDCR